MNTRNGALAVLASALACTAPAATAATPTTVNVRIEAPSKTIFEGPVTPAVQSVDGDGTGPHKCDGTNGGAGTVAGATPTSLLDTAVRGSGQSWAGSFNASFDDFLVNRIGARSSTKSQFWGVAVDGKSLEVGGCQKVVTAGHDVLWAFDSFGKKLLHASGPKQVGVGKVASFKVIDTENGTPVAGAKIGGAKTNANGVAKLSFKRAGARRFKATAPKSIRSNQLKLTVR
ncbi:MAG: hypothetical protein QOF65_2318 [Thermoleophilaceae bacterium]|nr:hypothetical protein [Thermoleophilaceae bacterium]